MKKLVQSVIVGVDFSTYSKVVFNQAFLLAKHLSADLHVLYVEPNIAVANVFGPPFIVPLTNKSAIKRDLEKFYRATVGTVPLYFHIRQGDPSFHLTKFSAQKNSLLVVGYKGRSKLSRFMLGSVAERIGLKSKCPVWIHRGQKVALPKKMIIPHDLSQTANKAFNWSRHLSSQLGGKLQLLYVHPEVFPIMDFSTYEQLADINKSDRIKKLKQLRKNFPRVEIKSLNGDEAQKIVEYAKGSDLIVMGPHSHKGIFHSFGKVTSKVVRSSQTPVIVYHES